LADIVTSVPVGRLNNQKMMTLNDMVHSQLFLRPECRAIILPVVVKRVKELLTGPQEVRLYAIFNRWNVVLNNFGIVVVYTHLFSNHNLIFIIFGKWDLVYFLSSLCGFGFG
jgi:hypothetical protein